MCVLRAVGRIGLLVCVLLLVVSGTAGAAPHEMAWVTKAIDGRPVDGLQGDGQDVVSSDGRFVVFESGSSYVVWGDDNYDQDVFVRDLAAGTTTLVSRNSYGAIGDGGSFAGSISDDGRFVVFASAATNLVRDDTNNDIDVFVHEIATEETTRVSATNDGQQIAGRSIYPAISGDGRYVAFIAYASSDGSGPTMGRIYVRDRVARTTTLANRADGADGASANAGGWLPRISADGRTVAFVSTATNLDGLTGGKYQVFVRDLDTADTALVSRASGPGGAPATEHALDPSVSADGRFVSFMTQSPELASDDPHEPVDVLVRDRTAENTEPITRTGDATAETADGSGGEISADGRFVAFVSEAGTSALRQVWVRDRTTGGVTLASRASGPDGAPGNGDSYMPAISASGRFVTFLTYADNLIGGNGDAVFRRELPDPSAPPPAPGATPTAEAPVTDPAAGVETAPREAPGLALRLGARRRLGVSRRGRVAVTVASRSRIREHARITLRAVGRRRWVLARSVLRIAPMRRSVVRLRLTRRALSLVRSRRAVPARLTLSWRNAEGRTETTAARVTIRAGRARR